MLVPTTAGEKFAPVRTADPVLVASQISNGLPPGISLVSANNLEEWFLDIQVLDENPIYAGETYRLKFRFSDKYPIGESKLPRGTKPSVPMSCANIWIAIC